MATFTTRQVTRLNFHVRGAATSEICDVAKLAKQVWGDRADAENSGLLALPYLWRRFGPPWSSSDPYKDIAGYVLTTPEPDIFLSVRSTAYPIVYGVGYLMKTKAETAAQYEIGKPYLDWQYAFAEWFLKKNPQEKAPIGENSLYWTWITDQKRIAEAVEVIGEWPSGNAKTTPTMKRMSSALKSTMKDLLTPVSVRDVTINLFGRCDASHKFAEPSKFAGLGVPVNAMAQILKITKNNT